MAEMTTEEDFRTIARFPGYRFGNDGSVWSCWARRSLGVGRGTTFVLSGFWRKLSPARNREGYLYVSLREHPFRSQQFVHRLILEAFRGPCPEGMEAAHDNGNPADNRLDNLAWKTPAENQRDRVRHGTHSRGERNRRAKLSNERVAALRKDFASGITNKAELARKYGVSRSLVSLIVLGKARRHG